MSLVHDDERERRIQHLACAATQQEVELLGRRHEHVDRVHVLQQFLDLPAFPGELLGVGQVLVLAPAAAAEERTLRGDAVG